MGSRRRTTASLSSLVLAAAVVAGAQGTTAQAEPPETTPGGPWGDESSLSGVASYEQMWADLQRLEDRGAIELEPAPLQSNLGRDIPVVTIGDGPTPVMLIANQHGNEFMVSRGMMDLIQQVAGNNGPEAQEIRDNLTVTIVPRVNVDGFDGDVTDARGNTTPWRQNYDPTCDVGCNYWVEGRGYDINRYHSYGATPYDNPYVAGEDTLNEVPEAIAMRTLWDELQPVVMVDYHHQGTYVDDDGRMITGSIMWPNATATAEQLGIADEFAQTITKSQRAASVMLQAVDSYGYANITRYPSTTTPGIARNAYGLLGSASVLFELRGGIGQKSAGYISKTASVTGYELLKAIADGSWETADLSVIENIRERGDYVRDPRGE
ncbi:M14 family zinc carboxypeptidase [uncultured Ornithinimicrobium sp.]|uniref:M14 family zinc carboxypeptidase n=1 Tax=uncultured Ornithinimicrobium sp. TaxID=259307 RepID=UPI00259399FA|nr:M14 family zinc carboxypeptidase [uncultured Ornithinimicrobium sp.]